MVERKFNKANRIFLITLISVLLVIVNYYIGKFVLSLGLGIYKVFPQLTTIDHGLNITCHIFTFFIFFIPTILLYKKKSIDFGYRWFNKKSFGIGLLTVFIAVLIKSIIERLFGVFFYQENLTQWFIFQIFFSGLGEELMFRAVPLTLLTYVYEEETIITVRNKCKIDFGIIISAIIFGFAHIYTVIEAGLLFQPSLGAFWSFFSTCVAGIIFGVIYKKAKSVWLVMLLHGISNTLAGILSILLGLI